MHNSEHVLESAYFSSTSLLHIFMAEARFTGLQDPGHGIIIGIAIHIGKIFVSFGHRCSNSNNWKAAENIYIGIAIATSAH